MMDANSGSLPIGKDWIARERRDVWPLSNDRHIWVTFTAVRSTPGQTTFADIQQHTSRAAAMRDALANSRRYGTIRGSNQNQIVDFGRAAGLP